MEVKQIYELYYNIPDDGNYYRAIDINCCSNIKEICLAPLLAPTNTILCKDKYGLIVNKSLLTDVLTSNRHISNDVDLRDCIQYLACLYINREFKKDLEPYVQGFLWGLYYGS